jgi:hypothetical protein
LADDNQKHDIVHIHSECMKSCGHTVGYMIEAPGEVLSMLRPTSERAHLENFWVKMIGILLVTIQWTDYLCWVVNI